MQITIMAVGKIRKSWLREGLAEYTQRLKRFDSVKTIEVADERDGNSAKERVAAMEKEGERLLKQWPERAWCIALDPSGETLGSMELAKFIGEWALRGQHHLAFIIGGSHGLSENVKKRCRKIVSFGPNIFPHQLFRLMLLEQIYRVRKILTGGTYHK